MALPASKAAAAPAPNSIPMPLMPVGTFVTHYGQQVHFDGAKAEDATLLIVGEGPGTSTPAETK